MNSPCRNLAVTVDKKRSTGSEAEEGAKRDFVRMATLYEMSAEFWLQVTPTAAQDGQDVISSACIALYLAAACTLLHFQQTEGQSTKILQSALDLLR